MSHIKNVLVTGGSRGIGESVVRLFSENGYRVFINYQKSDEQAEVLARETGGIPYKADVSNLKDTMDMVDHITQKYGSIDVLVNNAGISQQKLFSDITENDWDNMFDVNVKSIFCTTKAVLPYMIHNKSGKIINVSSMWGITGASCEVHYSASKSAVIGFTKALAKEVGLSGICVNCVAPGVIQTDMNAHLSSDDITALKDETPLNCIGTTQDVAEAIFFLAGDKSKFITGQVISVNGGLVI